MLTDSKGWTSALVTARWPSEEKSMSDLLLQRHLGWLTRAGDRRKERSKRIWIQGDVMMLEFEKRGWPLRINVEKDLHSGLKEQGHAKKRWNSGFR